MHILFTICDTDSRTLPVFIKSVVYVLEWLVMDNALY